MSFAVTTLPLSSLNPVKMVYDFNFKEILESEKVTNSSQINYIKHELLSGVQDFAISKHTLLALTNQKNLKTIFKNQQKIIDVKNIAGTFYLKVFSKSLDEEETTVKIFNNKFFCGGKGQLALFHVVPISPGIVELKVGENYVNCSSNYPYDLVLSPESLQTEEIFRQRFFLDYVDKKITLQTQTSDGLRYLSIGVDRALRFVGINLNLTKINDYFLEPVFVSSSTITHGMNPSTSETRYYNDVFETNNQKNVAVKKQIPLDTHLLVSCPSSKLAEQSEVSLNIALAKTNYSSSGAFNTSIE